MYFETFCIFERVEKKDAKVKEEANVAYQRMMSTMKSESSTSRAVNTNKALDSSSEDELENAIQRAVLGNKAKSKLKESCFMTRTYIASALKIAN